MGGGRWAGGPRGVWRGAASVRLPSGRWVPLSMAVAASVILVVVVSPRSTDPGELLVMIEAAPSARPLPRLLVPLPTRAPLLLAEVPDAEEDEREDEAGPPPPAPPRPRARATPAPSRPH